MSILSGDNPFYFKEGFKDLNNVKLGGTAPKKEGPIKIKNAEQTATYCFFRMAVEGSIETSVPNNKAKTKMKLAQRKSGLDSKDLEVVYDVLSADFSDGGGNVHSKKKLIDRSEMDKLDKEMEKLFMSYGEE